MTMTQRVCDRLGSRHDDVQLDKLVSVHARGSDGGCIAPLE